MGNQTTTNTSRQEEMSKGAYNYAHHQSTNKNPQSNPNVNPQPKYEFVPNTNVNTQPGTYSSSMTTNTTYNPYANNTGTMPIQNAPTFKQKVKGIITVHSLKDSFKTFAIEGKYLNKDRFNDTIESLFSFNIPEMHYTYLSEKIYELLDESGDGKIQEEEYFAGLKNVLTNKDFRLKCI
jgi:hypothetical protein